MGHVAYARVAICLLSIAFVETGFSMDGTPPDCESAQIFQTEFAAQPPSGAEAASAVSEPSLSEELRKLLDDPMVFRKKLAKGFIPMSPLAADNYLMLAPLSEFKAVLRWMTKAAEGALEQLWVIRAYHQAETGKANSAAAEPFARLFQDLLAAQSKTITHKDIFDLALRFKNVFAPVRPNPYPSYPPEDLDPRLRPLLFLPVPADVFASISVVEFEWLLIARIYLFPI